MAVYEKNVLLTSQDRNGNKSLLYPITRLDCVDGAEELLAQLEALAAATLPSVTNADNGKILMVVDGTWKAVTIPTYTGVVEVE